MKSPISGKEMTFHKEKRTMTFRKEEFEVLYHFYLCEDSKEQFTTTELDNLNLYQLHNQYRAKYHLPFPDQIKSLREKYDLPASKMAEVLGFGINVYRNYENGEIPSESNARLIQLAEDAIEFKKLLMLSTAFSGSDLDKQILKIEHLMEADKNNFNFDIEKFLMGNKLPSEYTGFKVPQLSKFIEMIVFFAQLKPWKTKMNKLLFYSDFLHFKETCFSISGAQYKAISKGPVPKNFGGIFDFAADNDFVDIMYYEFDKGYGELFEPNKNKKFNPSLFTKSELGVIKKVANNFKESTTSEIVEISHAEKAWKENVDGYNLISYKYGFDIITI